MAQITVKKEFSFDTPVNPGVYAMERINDWSDTYNILREVLAGEDYNDVLYEYHRPNVIIAQVQGTQMWRLA